MIYLFHGLFWIGVYLMVFSLDLVANEIAEYYVLGVYGQTATIVASVLAAILAMYVAHQVANHVAPLPKKDIR